MSHEAQLKTTGMVRFIWHRTTFFFSEEGQACFLESRLALLLGQSTGLMEDASLSMLPSLFIQ